LTPERFKEAGQGWVDLKGLDCAVLILGWGADDLAVGAPEGAISRRFCQLNKIPHRPQVLDIPKNAATDRGHRCERGCRHEPPVNVEANSGSLHC